MTKAEILARFPTATMAQEEVRGDTKLIGLIYAIRVDGALLGCGTTPRSAWHDAGQAARYNTRWSEA